MTPHQHGSHSRRHVIVMAICCLVPLLALGLAWWLGASLGIAGLVALLLLCPLLHLLLMRGMGHESAEAPSQPATEVESDQANPKGRR